MLIKRSARSLLSSVGGCNREKNTSVVVFSRIASSLLQQQHPQQRRTYVTEKIEPPLDSDVPERPYTLVLAQDGGYGNKESWQERFETTFPTKYGIPFTTWQFSLSSPPTMEGFMEELQTDFTGWHHEAILVARGPWMSWMAQFYLEDRPLAALVLINPLPMNDAKALDLYKTTCLPNQPESLRSVFQDYVEHSENWILQLEPGAVPILVVTEPQQNGKEDATIWREMAELTAERHSDPENEYSHFGEVPVVHMEDVQPPVDVETILHDWIHERVL